jgi:hypothetical protein
MGTHYFLTPVQMADFKNVFIVIPEHELMNKDRLYLKAGTSEKSYTNSSSGHLTG